ncbi:hypothetical protein BGZ47_005894 [Haplosporangium gracile]|nr:hypothetical protein BGZ47_005894 [Haplosporangium gracile]
MTKVNIENLTDRDRQVIRIRIVTHIVIYVLHVVALWATILYQSMIEERQFKCRNWIGFFLPLFTVMSDPRLVFLREGSAPILFIVWLALAFEWHSAFSDTTITKAHDYALDAYANRVGCSHGDSACNLLSCSGSGSAARAASICASEETINLEAYDHTSSTGPNGASPASTQTPTTTETLTFLWSRLPSRVPVASGNANELNNSTSLRSRIPTSQFVLGHDDETNSAQSSCHQQAVDENEELEILPTNHTYSSHEEEEGFFDFFDPARVDIPRPITRSFTSVASMLSSDMSGPRSRADIPYSHHVQYLPSELTFTRIFMAHSIGYDQGPFMSTIAAATAAGQVGAQGAVDCVTQSTSFPRPQFAVAAAIEGAFQSESQLPSPQPQSPVTAIENAVEEDAQTSSSSSSTTQPQEVSEEKATDNDYSSDNNADAEDDATEEVSCLYGRYDLDEYKSLLCKRRMGAYFINARPQMLELAKYANDPLPEYPQ